MTAEFIRDLVEREIAGDWSRSNLHGCDLRLCLVPPELREYEDCGMGSPPTDPPATIELWLVLEEIPKDQSGYKIVFDEVSEMFGLAIKGNSRDVFIGYYGSFLDTYRGM